MITFVILCFQYVYHNLQPAWYILNNDMFSVDNNATMRIIFKHMCENLVIFTT